LDADVRPPGDYTFTYEVTTGGANAALKPTFSFTQTLLDPCLKVNGAVVVIPTNSDVT